MRQAINQSQPIRYQELEVDQFIKRHNTKSFGAVFITSRIKRFWIKYPCRKRKKVFLFCIIDILNEKAKDLKGLSVIVHSAFLFFFPHPRFFFFFYKFRKNSNVITYLYKNSIGNSIFLERDHFLFGINHRRRDMLYFALRCSPISVMQRDLKEMPSVDKSCIHVHDSVTRTHRYTNYYGLHRH